MNMKKMFFAIMLILSCLSWTTEKKNNEQEDCRIVGHSHHGATIAAGGWRRYQELYQARQKTAAGERGTA